MPRRKQTPMTYITFRIPTQLADSLREKCKDPFTNKVRYGETSRVITKLLAEHLKEEIK